MNHSEKRLLYFLLILLILGGGFIVVLNFKKKIQRLNDRERFLTTQLEELKVIQGDRKKLEGFNTWLDTATANPMDDEKVDSMLLERISSDNPDVVVSNISLEDQEPFIGNLVSSSITCFVKGEPDKVLRYIASLRDYEKLITLKSLNIARVEEGDEIQAKVSLRQIYAPVGDQEK